MLMHQLLIDAAHRVPNKPCFHWVDRDRGLTYAEAVEQMRRAAAALAEVGVRPGDRVAVVAHNGLDYLTTITGCWYLGAIPALVNVKFADELDHYFADHEPAAVVYTHDLHPQVSTAAESRGPARPVLLCMDGPMGGALALPELITAGLPVPPMATDQAAAAHLSYTSGSTGRPKGAVLNHEPTVTAARVIGERLQVSQHDVSFGPSALSSSYQLVGNLLPQLAVGASINVMGRWTPESGYDALLRRRATMFIGNPVVLQDLLTLSRDRGVPPTLRMTLSGGGPVPPTLSDAFRDELAMPLVESYGQSELGGFVALGYPRLGVNAPGDRRIGPALPDKEVRILSQAGQELAVGQVGEICLRGGYMRGYWGMPEKTAQALRDNWLWTGDLGSIDADGFLTMRGRRAELLTIEGQDWFPRDVEEALCTVPPVTLAALVGIPVDGVTMPLAVVTTENGAELDQSAARAAVAAAVPYDTSALRIVAIPEMPMTPTSKIAKAALREQFCAAAG